MGKPENISIESGEMRVSTIQPTERQTERGKVPRFEERTVEETKNAFCCEAAR